MQGVSALAAAGIASVPREAAVAAAVIASGRFMATLRRL